jgi:undecaprenyl-diphosphatase
VAATFVLWGGVVVLLGVGRWRWPWRVLAYLVAAVPVATVMFSRVYRGMHFTTDVLAGLALGVLALSGAVVATRAWALGARPARPGHAPARNEEVAP